MLSPVICCQLCHFRERQHFSLYFKWRSRFLLDLVNQVNKFILLVATLLQELTQEPAHQDPTTTDLQRDLGIFNSSQRPFRGTGQRSSTIAFPSCLEQRKEREQWQSSPRTSTARHPRSKRPSPANPVSSNILLYSLNTRSLPMMV